MNRIGESVNLHLTDSSVIAQQAFAGIRKATNNPDPSAANRQSQASASISQTHMTASEEPQFMPIGLLLGD